MVAAQTLRSDLYYRLNVFPMRIPPLRERPEDIPVLVRHFVQQLSRRHNRRIDTIPSDTVDALVRYQWPGHIRELQNVIERGVVVSRGPILKVPIAEFKGAYYGATRDRETGQGSEHSARHGRRDRRNQILEALEQPLWVIAGPKGAAARPGMKRSTLQFRMRKLGIQIARTGARPVRFRLGIAFIPSRDTCASSRM